jgi:hypothetical protein
MSMTSWRRALGYISLRWKDPSTCEACGGDFTCGATITGCWCTEVKLTKDTRARLRSRYGNCLCRACLERARDGDAPPGGDYRAR